MATVPRRLLTLCVALAIVLGASGWSVPYNAEQKQGIYAEMPGGCPPANTPCTEQTPGCVGCITVPLLAILPTSPPAASASAVRCYEMACEALSGLSIEPELAPPILAA